MSQHAFESIALILIVLSIGAVILCAGLCRAAAKPRPLMNAVPVRHTPPVAPARSRGIPLACVTRGHVIPGWAHNREVWFCVREDCTYTAAYCHDDDLPYDQAAVAVFDAARKITREAASGGAA